MFARAGDRPLTKNLTLTPRNLGTTTGGNVVGEITGRDPSLAPVLLACHLDSWWLGTGSFDDGAGCAIAAAAALHVGKYGQPLRTIRVLMAGAEETGQWGSNAYRAAHLAAPGAMAPETDSGAGRWGRFGGNFR